jgi:RecA-family ATPase
MDVLIWSGEDSIKKTLIPRLIAMKADMSRIHFVTGITDGERRRPFDPATDMPKLAEAATKIGRRIGLVIIDSIVSAVSGDSHKNAETRRGLQPVIDLAERLHCAALGITHFSKGTAGHDPVERVTGSLAFAALARVVMVTVKMKEPDEHGRDRILTRAASNIGPDGGGFYYAPEQIEISRSITAQRVMWRGPAEGSAKELLKQAESGRQKPGEFLLKLLADGPMLAAEAIAKAEDKGYTAKDMENARRYHKVKTRKLGVEKGWEWSLEDWPVDGDDKPTKH